ncbi:MAG: sulfatase-like hydrolase/transferase [Flavobacterium sp.]|nr:sulfatase-like hydrolase/transferase [Flavobacterium sp.]
MKTLVLAKLFFLGIIVLGSISIKAQTTKRPNILIILADDMGHGDLSINGGKTPTPNIDRIISEGVRFSNFMTNPVCSPTRAGLLTGLNPLLTGAGPNTDGNLDAKITNFGNYFQKEGYKTGLFGKWHNSPNPTPDKKAKTINEYGFDRFVGFYAGAVDYYSKGSTGWFHDDKLVENELDYSTDLISKYAIDFMDKSTHENNPFLCYVPFNAVHGPHVVKEELLKRVPAEIMNKVKNKKSYDFYRKAVINMPEWRNYNAEKYKDASWKLKQDKLEPEEMAMLYSAVITSFDDNVGLLMDYLKKNNLLENTIVLFFSDNGGTEYAGNNAPFRGFKHSLYEGGIHSAAAMIIPKTILTNTKKNVPEMCGYLDIFPTLAELTNCSQKLPKNLDGISLVNLIKGTAKPQTDRYYYWIWRDHDVLRSDKWKLFRYQDKVELYNMVNDIGETKNVAASNPLVIKELLKQIEKEAKKSGVANVHLPLDIKNAKPKAKGKILAIDVSSDDDLKKQTIKILKNDFTVLADYYLEYDIKVDPKSEMSFCYFSPIKGANSIYNDKMGVDQTNNLLQSPTEFNDKWKHIAVGLGSFSPLNFSDLGLTFKFKKPGKTTVYLDNIRIKNMKGEVVYELFIDEVDKDKIVSRKATVINK